MIITSSTNSTDEITKAHVFIPDHGAALLCFEDRYGCSRVTLHGVPAHVAEATAKAFNDALAALAATEDAA